VTEQKQKRLPGWEALTAVFGARALIEQVLETIVV
jgi:hypothetical protein